MLEQLHHYFYPDKENSDRKEILKRITEVLDYGNYLFRLESLSPEEKEDFVTTMDGGHLTDSMRKTLDESDQKKKDHYIEMWARSNYFRQCAWQSYLSGETKDKPALNQKEEK